MIPNTQIRALKCASRINIVGTSGSGKTTFGRELAKIKNFPFIEMDQLFWKPNWQEPTDEEFIPKVELAASGGQWVLDGNYHSRTKHIKWPRSQVVVFIDLPFSQTIFRVSKRAISRSLNQTEMWPGTGNRESLRRSFFSRESIIWWAMTHHEGNRSRYLDANLFEDFPHLHFIHLNSQNKVADCLEALRDAERISP